MKKSVKRFLSTILALTMLCSCMVVMNVTAFAATTTTTWDFSQSPWTTYTTTKYVYTYNDLSIRHNGTDSSVNSGNAFKFNVNSNTSVTSGYYCSLTLAAGDIVSVDTYYGSSTSTNVVLGLTSDGSTSGGQTASASCTKTSKGTVTFDAVTTAGTYYIFTDSTSAGSTFYASVTKTSTGEVVYWPTADSQTAATTDWVGGEAITYLSGNTASNRAAIVGGVTSNSSRVRLGSDAYSANKTSDDDTPTIANNGYITFPGQDGGFTIAVSAASSGSSPRTFYVGTVDTSGDITNDSFTDVASLTVPGGSSASTTVTATIASSSASSTYAIYVKPTSSTTTDEETGVETTTYEVYDNTNIYSIEVASADAEYLTTPAVTLSSAEVVDGTLTITGTFNSFSTNYYEVDSITLRTALGKSTESEAKWTINDIVYLTENSDGTVSFIGTVDDPEESAKFQAYASYNGIDDLTSDITAETIYSNSVTYTYTAAE